MGGGFRSSKASAVGVDAQSNRGGNGGAGTASSYSGSSVTYAGGGGGGVQSGTTVGSGGAGGSYSTSTNPYQAFAGGDGGSGVVILRYPSSYTIDTSQIGSDLSSTTSNSVSGYLITTIICANSATTGTGTITFA